MQVILRNMKFFGTATLLTKEALFQHNFVCKKQYGTASTFLGELLFQSGYFLKRTTFVKHNFSEVIRFHSLISFSNYTCYLPVSYKENSVQITCIDDVEVLSCGSFTAQIHIIDILCKEISLF